MIKAKQFSVYFIGILMIIIAGCSTYKENKDTQNLERFNAELLQLKEYFKIPGMAILVKEKGEIVLEEYLGKSDLRSDIAVDSTTVFPIASLTKIFSGIAMMQLQEQHKLSLENTVQSYFPDLPIGDSLQVKHILSHTSQGIPGKNFYYSSRFGMLTKIINDASGISFKEYVDQNIIQKLGLKHTFLLKDSTQIVDIKFAKPYLLDNSIQDGFVDYGFSASAGIASTVRDLSMFDDALDANVLISEASKNTMYTPFQPHLPYGYGIFSQHFEGKQLTWAYGQYDCYASLYLKIPENDLTLILFANNNLMSDPARLIYGDVMSSLFAVSFLKNMVLDYNNLPLFENEQTLAQATNYSTLRREKLRAQALAASFMARFDVQEMKTSKLLLEKIFKQYPKYLEYADLSLLHNLMFLKEVAFHRELGAFNDFDTQIKNIAQNLLHSDPDNPYANYYLASFYDKTGNKELAKRYFERIVEAKNFSENWYTKEAALWLKNNHENK